MQQIWFTSDSHFQHENIIKYCDRPYNSVEEMDEDLVKQWNDNVAPGDIVWHLGDIGWFKNEEQADKFLNRLHGQINLILGNHDKKFLKRCNRFTKVCTDYTGKIRGHIFHLYHYPVLSWNRKFHGSIHLFGHTHNSIVHPDKNAFDVGVDAFKYRPINYDEVIERVNRDHETIRTL